jgi:hypothetical protein
MVILDPSCKIQDLQSIIDYIKQLWLSNELSKLWMIWMINYQREEEATVAS